MITIVPPVIMRCAARFYPSERNFGRGGIGGASLPHRSKGRPTRGLPPSCCVRAACRIARPMFVAPRRSDKGCGAHSDKSARPTVPKRIQGLLQKLQRFREARQQSPCRSGRSRRMYDGRAFGVMRTDHLVRRHFISLVENRWFDRMVLLLIITNSVVMAMQDPLASQPPDWTTACEWAFTVLFTIEATCKMLAQGILLESKHAYLKDAWNCLDLLTVIVSWVSLLLPDAGNLSAIRSVRVLKPLRTVQRVPGLRVLIGALIHSLPALGDVARLFLFFIVAFGVISVELFAGTLHYRCYDTAAASPSPVGSCACPYTTRQELASRNATCDDGCAAGFECRYSEVNPSNGVTSFDNIFDASANIFQVGQLHEPCFTRKLRQCSACTPPFPSAVA